MTGDTLGEYVERFLGIKHNPQTQTWYSKYLAPMVLSLGAERPMRTITRADAEVYWRSVRARRNVWESHPTKTTQRRSLSPTTLHNHLRAARTFWNEMVRQQVVDYNPFDHIKPPKDRRPAVMKAITTEDLRAIWQAAMQSNTRDFAIITVMATSGVRAGELVSMNLHQLDLRQGIAWVKGKRGWRKVFLGKASVQAIQAYINARPANKGDALWLNVFGQPLTTDGVRQLVDRLAEKGRITGRHNLHAFRHRAAQAWLDKGINAEIVAQALGHADVTVTLMIYSNQDDRRVAKAIRQAEMAPFEEPANLADLDLDEITNLLGRTKST